MNIGQTIFHLRHEKGYTQEQLSDILGVSTAAVSKWECNNTYPDITLLPRMAEIFGVSIDFLLGYEKPVSKSVSAVISEAKELRMRMKGDEAEDLIKKTWARYPNNTQLMFEYARNKFLNACHKKRDERETMLREASQLFAAVAQNDSGDGNDTVQRAWSLHYLTVIHIMRADYDMATVYNNRLLGAEGIYPNVTKAIIEIHKQHDEKTYDLLMRTMYSCIYQYTSLIGWILYGLLEKHDYEHMIEEGIRAIGVFEKFADCGWILNDLSCCYESVALAYAYTADYERCFDFLEKACQYAVEHDREDFMSNRKGYGMLTGIDLTDEKPASCRTMLQTLNSNERSVYNPIRQTKRFNAMIDILRQHEMP